MARQPFLPQHKGKHFCFDQRGLIHNNAAAASIGRSLTDWAKVEYQIALIMVVLLGHSSAAGIALFGSIRNLRAQREAMQAVADASGLDAEHRLILEAVMSYANSVAKERNDLAHGIFGWSFDLPDVSLWIDPVKLAINDAQTWLHLTSGDQTSLHASLNKREDLLFCYDHASLFAIEANIADIKEVLHQLGGLLRHRKGSSSPEHQWLSARPRVVQEIDRLRQGRRNDT